MTIMVMMMTEIKKIATSTQSGPTQRETDQRYNFDDCTAVTANSGSRFPQIWKVKTNLLYM
jgi:hypothetical protein